MTNKKSNKIKKKEKITKNVVIMKVLVVLGVFVLCFIAIYLMNYFFVEKSYIKINISTDKELEYVLIEGDKELITTQKYISDLDYSMRYDIKNFTVFKYKNQDIFRFINDERVLVIVEESGLPNLCYSGSLDMTYNNCYVQVDNYTEEHYITTNGKTYKITVKSPNTPEYKEGVNDRINYMLNSFKMIF